MLKILWMKNTCDLSSQSRVLYASATGKLCGRLFLNFKWIWRRTTKADPRHAIRNYRIPTGINFLFAKEVVQKNFWHIWLLEDIYNKSQLYIRILDQIFFYNAGLKTQKWIERFFPYSDLNIDKLVISRQNTNFKNYQKIKLGGYGVE